MFYKYFVLEHFETQNSAPICVSRYRSGRALLRCTLGMKNKQFDFVDGNVFFASNVRCYSESGVIHTGHFTTDVYNLQ